LDAGNVAVVGILAHFKHVVGLHDLKLVQLLGGKV